MATMRQAVLVELGRVELRQVPVPEPGPGELLLAVEAALTCGTDLKTYRRGHPRIPVPTPMGHEVAGRVAAVGAGAAFREGDRLASVPTAPCGACRLCRRGHENLCPDAVGRMVFGAFADYVLLPRHIVEVNAFPRPDGMDAATAAALEPLACVVHGADRVALAHAERVVVLGDGPIALLFLQLAVLRGAGAVLVAGRHDNRLAAARALGADRTVNTAESSLDAAVADWSGGIGADVVIECVGSPELWEAGAELVAAGGELLVYGGAPEGTRACFDTERLHYLEVDVKGAFHYGREAVRRALELLADGAVRIGPLITHRLPLARLDEGLRLALEREAIKVAVTP